MPAVIDESAVGTLPPPADVQPLDIAQEEPPLFLAYHDDFSMPDATSLQYAGLRRDFDDIPGLGGVLTLREASQTVRLRHYTLADVAVEVRFLLNGGIGRLSLRMTASDSYGARIAASGLVELYRGDQLLSWAQLAPGDERRLRLSAMGEHLSVSVDDVVILTADDPAPLPAGWVGMTADSSLEPGVLVDALDLWTTDPAAAAQTALFAPLDVTPAPFFLAAPVGLPDYTSLLPSAAEAFYVLGRDGRNDPLRTLDRSGIEQTLPLDWNSQTVTDLWSSFLSISPDGEWAAKSCKYQGGPNSGYDLCIIALTGPHAGYLRPLIVNPNSTDAGSDRQLAWFTHPNGERWVLFNSFEYYTRDDGFRAVFLPPAPQDWSNPNVSILTTPQPLALDRCNPIAAAGDALFCIDRGADLTRRVERFDPLSGTRTAAFTAAEVPEPVAYLDAVKTAEGDLVITYIVSFDTCDIPGQGCAVGWSRFPSGGGAASHQRTPMQDDALLMHPQISPDGSRVAVKRAHWLGGTSYSYDEVVYDLTQPNPPPILISTVQSYGKGFDWGLRPPCSLGESGQGGTQLSAICLPDPQTYYDTFIGIMFWAIFNETNEDQQTPLSAALPGTLPDIPRVVTDDHRYLMARVMLDNIPLNDAAAGVAYMRSWAGS
ncbi:MAG: hypothetical protein JNL42_01045, partial [Anaerolineae bacterium]|nr:hypothetical protein [Anaerolineae bacterium]